MLSMKNALAVKLEIVKFIMSKLSSPRKKKYKFLLHKSRI